MRDAVDLVALLAGLPASLSTGHRHAEPCSCPLHTTDPEIERHTVRYPVQEARDGR